jgi:ABC-2 type transport system ATP-binding protein
MPLRENREDAAISASALVNVYPKGTHYLEEADRLAHRLAIVDRGKVVAEGTPEGLKAELSGDAVHIDLAEPSDESQIKAALATVAAAREISMEGIQVRARADHGASAVPR